MCLLEGAAIMRASSQPLRDERCFELKRCMIVLQEMWNRALQILQLFKKCCKHCSPWHLFQVGIDTPAEVMLQIELQDDDVAAVTSALRVRLIATISTLREN